MSVLKVYSGAAWTFRWLQCTAALIASATSSKTNTASYAIQRHTVGPCEVSYWDPGSWCEEVTWTLTRWNKTWRWNLVEYRFKIWLLIQGRGLSETWTLLTKLTVVWSFAWIQKQKNKTNSCAPVRYVEGCINSLDHTRPERSECVTVSLRSVQSTLTGDCSRPPLHITKHLELTCQCELVSRATKWCAIINSTLTFNPPVHVLTWRSMTCFIFSSGLHAEWTALYFFGTLNLSVALLQSEATTE